MEPVEIIQIQYLQIFEMELVTTQILLLKIHMNMNIPQPMKIIPDYLQGVGIKQFLIKQKLKQSVTHRQINDLPQPMKLEPMLLVLVLLQK